MEEPAMKWNVFLRRLTASALSVVLLLSLCTTAFASETGDAVCTTPDQCTGGTHVEGCALYVKPDAPTCTQLEGCTDTAHAQGCPLYKAPKAPECTQLDGCTDTAHAQGCPLYQAPKAPECALLDGCTDTAHAEGCPLYKAPKAPECALLDGCTDTTHAEGCPLYEAPKAPTCTTPDQCVDGNHIEGCPLYVKPADPTPVQKVQALIDSLPGTVDETNAETVRALLTAIDKAKAALTDEERNSLDTEKYVTAQTALGAYDEAQTLQTDPIVKIGDQGYATLGDAVAAVPTDNTPTEITFLKDAAGGGVQVTAGQNIIFNLANHTYTVGAPTVGSTGTETSGFHLLKGSTVTMQNGTIKASDYYNLQMMIQNYSDLTLKDITLDADNQTNLDDVVSINHGNVLITGNTNIYGSPSSSDKLAFDVYYWPDGGYPEVHVTVDTTGTITGDIEYDAHEGNNSQDAAKKATLQIKNGTINGSISANTGSSEGEEMNHGITITGGSFSDNVSAFVPDGNTAIQGDDGRFTIGVDPNAAVAEVNGKGYMTLAEAIAAAPEGATVTLLRDTTSDYFNFPRSVTLDLGGHRLTSSVIDNYALGVKDNVNVEIKNGEIKCNEYGISCTDGNLTLANMSLESTTKYAIKNFDNSTVTINKDATVIGVYYPIYIAGTEKGDISQKPTLNVYGTVRTTGGYAISGNGSNQASTTINIYEGAKIEGVADGIYHPQPNGVINVYGGTITAETGIEMRAGTLNVSGGTITGTYTPFFVKANDDGNTTHGVGIAVAQHNTQQPIDVNISGGNISGYYAVYESNPQNNPTSATDKIDIDIIGGNFKTINGGKETVCSTSKRLEVSGGTFDHAVPPEYCADSYHPRDNGNGTYTVHQDSFGAPEFIWENNSGTLACTAKFTCATCGSTKTLPCIIDPSTGTASVTYGGKTYTDNRSLNIIDAQGNTTTEAAAYTHLSGASVTIRCSGAFDLFESVTIDSNTTPLTKGTDYTVARGSTVITFKPAFLNTLSVGTHQVNLHYKAGSYTTDVAQATLLIHPNWDKLTVKVTADRSSVRPGKTITYTVKVTNNTGVDLSNYTLTCTPDKNLTFVSATGSYTTADNQWKNLKLDNGKTATLTAKFTVKSTTKNGTTLPFTVKITAASGTVDAATYTLPNNVTPTSSVSVKVSNKASIIPDTGDTSNIGVWTAVMVVTLIVLVIVACVFFKKRRK